MLEELKEANEYISSKIDKYKSPNLELIKEIEKDAEINNVPIISKEIREYLKFIIKTNKNIKNIAITGIYGAGKSSIWLTHIKKWNVEKKPIFISLGNYDVPVNTESNTFEESTQENRVERQIINQILAQIDKDKIILSKYNFKKNISFLSAGLKAICYSLVILSVFSWFYRSDITAIFQLYLINWSILDTSLVSIILFLVSLVTFFYA